MVGEEHDLRLGARRPLYLAQQPVERLERDCQPLGAADVEQPVGRLEEAEEVARGRRREEALAEAAHVGAPDRVGRDVDEELEGQRLLIVQLVHVGRGHLVGRAPADVLAHAAAQFLRLAVEVEALVAGGRGGAEHLGQRDVRQRGEGREEACGLAEVVEHAARLRLSDDLERHPVQAQQQTARARLWFADAERTARLRFFRRRKQWCGIVRLADDAHKKNLPQLVRLLRVRMN